MNTKHALRGRNKGGSFGMLPINSRVLGARTMSGGNKERESSAKILTMLGKWSDAGRAQGRHRYRESIGDTVTGRSYRRGRELQEGVTVTRGVGSYRRELQLQEE
jgi:hypothetical protein